MSLSDVRRETVVYVKRWYDRATKSWVVQRCNVDHDQVGDADYVYTKREADDLCAQYQKEIDS